MKKIFAISFVWATVTILLPVIHSEKAYNDFHILTMMIERFLFVFAITIPFDIRDMNADSQTGLKTIPLLIGEKKSTYTSMIALVLFFAVVVIHYSITNQWFIIGAFAVSFLTTIVFFTNLNELLDVWRIAVHRENRFGYNVESWKLEVGFVRDGKVVRIFNF